MGTLGFSYVGLAFLLMLFVPNLLWVKAQPEGYSARREPALPVSYTHLTLPTMATV